MGTVRYVWLYTDKFNINLIVQYIAGKDNVYADVLSRWQYYNGLDSSVVRFLKTYCWKQVSPDALRGICGVELRVLASKL